MSWKYLRFLLLNVFFIQLSSASFYGFDKNVVELTQSNFRDFVFNKDYASIIEFYNSFCGACRRYSQTWKSFALDVSSWNDIVKVAAIDCSENDELCRKYDIQTYPSIRYFSPYLKDDPEETQLGMHSRAFYRNVMRHLTVEYLRKETNAPKHWPDLTPLGNISQPGDIFNNVSDEVQYAILVYPGPPKDYNGYEFILDYHRHKDFIIRIINSTETAMVFGIESRGTIHVIDRNLKVEALRTATDDNYDANKRILNKFLTDHGIDVQQLEDTSDSTTVANDESRLTESEAKVLEKVKNMTHVVFRADLEKALRYSLTKEVFKKREIRDENLQALSRYIAVVKKYSPLGAKGDEFLEDLSNFVNSSSESINATTYKQKILELEIKTEIFDIRWVGCQGSAPNYRGYSCGLWTLFHYLTVRAANSIDANDPVEVLSTILNYIKHFFGCTECAMHFQEMAVAKDMWNVTTKDQAIMWLWRAHNSVSDRLSGDVTEDPQFPKIKFPSAKACPQCRVGFNFREKDTLEFLKKMYADENINNFGMESIEEDVTPETLVDYNKDKSDFILGNLSSVVVIGFCILFVFMLMLILRKKRLQRVVKTPSNV